MPQKKVTDRLLGQLVFDGWYLYEGKKTVGGIDVGFSVEIPDDGKGETEPQFARAREVIRDLRRFRRAAEDYAVKKMLSLKNGTWLEEDEEPVTDKEFRRRLEFYALTFREDGGVTFWHRDGELFLGHGVVVEMNAKDRFTDAYLFG